MRNFVNTTIETPEVNFTTALKDLYEGMKFQLGIYTKLAPSHITYKKRYDRNKQFISFVGTQYSADGYITLKVVSNDNPKDINDIKTVIRYYYDTTGEKPVLSYETRTNINESNPFYIVRHHRTKRIIDMYFEKFDEFVTIMCEKDNLFDVYKYSELELKEFQRFYELRRHLNLEDERDKAAFEDKYVGFNDYNGGLVGAIRVLEETEEASKYRLRNFENEFEEKIITIDNRINDYVSFVWTNHNDEDVDKWIVSDERVREKEVTKNDDGSTDIKLVISEPHRTVRRAYYTLDSQGRVVYSNSHKPGDEESYYEYERFDF